MSFPGTPLAVLVELQLGDTWTDITNDVYTREDITITRGRADEGEDTDPGSCSLVLNNRDGKYSPRNPRSPYFGLLGRNTPLRVSVLHNGARIPRFVGEVSAWPPRWDLSGNDVYVPLEAAGVLRRLNANVSALESALRRFIVASEPSAYWPLTDGEHTQNAAPVVGGNVAYLNVRTGDLTAPMEWASYDLASWLEPVAMLPEDAERGVFRGFIRAGNRPLNWAFEFVRGGVGGFDSMGVQVSGAGTDDDPTRHWYLGFDHTDNSLSLAFVSIGDTSSSYGQVTPNMNVPELYDENAHVIRLTATEASNNRTAWSIHVDGRLLRSGTSDIAPRAPIRWLYEWWVPDDDIAERVALGHATVWDASTAPDPDELMLAYHGHGHETAGQRMTRVCEEASIPFVIIGDTDDTQHVGPQELDTPLAVLSSAASVDGGILYEDREEPRLVYRTNRSRYNRGLLIAED